MSQRGWLLILILAGCMWGLSLTPAAAQCEQTSGTTERDTYRSAILGQTMYYTVYLPPCYEAASADVYPVLYLMHGSNENDEHWLRLGLEQELNRAIVAGEMRPVIAVLPFGNVIANRNRFDTVSWNRIFLEELMPHIEATYPVSTDTAQRAIGGVSRGGFWAYQIAFRHPDLFAAAGGHSAFFDLNHAPDAYNPLDLARSAPDIESLRLWLDRGADDFAAPGLDIMHQRLTERGVSHTYNVYDSGQHNNTYWSEHLPAYVSFYAAALESVPDTISDTPQVTVTPRVSGFATNTPLAPVQTPLPLSATPESATAETVNALWLPGTAFPSLQTSLSRERLLSVAAGELDEDLIVTPDVLRDLQSVGVELHAQTRTVAPDALQNALWRDRSLYTLLPISAFTFQIRVLWLDDKPVPAQPDQYPFAFAGAAVSNFDATQLTRITLSGVTALARKTREALNNNSVEWAASGIAEYVQSSDFFHVSNEVSLVAGCPQSNVPLLGGNNSFCMQPDHAELFNRLDVDIVELSGNHNNDYGYNAYRDTLAFFRANNIATVGGGHTQAEARAPLRLSHHDNSVALVSCNIVGPYYALVNEDTNAAGGVRPGAAACDWNWLSETLPTLAEQVDTVIVTVQHREREEYTPDDAQRFDFRRLADLGADVVMGTSAHKPQTYEFYSTSRGETALIHYGMGNLFFDQPFWGNSRFFMNTLYLYEGRVQALEFYPGIIENQGRPRLMTPDERQNFLFFMLVEHNGF